MIKRETDSWLNSFMWEPNILTDLLDFEPRIFPEKYAFFFQQNFVGGSY